MASRMKGQADAMALVLIEGMRTCPVTGSYWSRKTYRVNTNAEDFASLSDVQRVGCRIAIRRLINTPPIESISDGAKVIDVFRYTSFTVGPRKIVGFVGSITRMVAI